MEVFPTIWPDSSNSITAAICNGTHHFASKFAIVNSVSQLFSAVCEAAR